MRKQCFKPGQCLRVNLLHWNGIITETFELNEKTLPQVKMPNRDGFIHDVRPYQKLKK